MVTINDVHVRVTISGRILALVSIGFAGIISKKIDVRLSSFRIIA